MQFNLLVRIRMPHSVFFFVFRFDSSKVEEAKMFNSQLAVCIISYHYHVHSYMGIFGCCCFRFKYVGCRCRFSGILKQTLLINFPRSLSLFSSIFLFDYISQTTTTQPESNAVSVILLSAPT